ncbi:hypothetical protein BN8_04183 [Fibrisoma limi BUZ 3]|uniref:OmpA-like domain-containing protein n=1 Tax=Fibrisoma limi BUZ 3 TaxID=1185876 RepID=I2GM33_9BACT|nr:OmpA family protein [Fibrisoma limi]CCH54959.1 hypothetical protein BN8_04183 [Fibrisoma limi BUZ 3]
MRLTFYFVCCLITQVALAQDRIIGSDNTVILGKIRSASPQQIHFLNATTNRPDSIVSEKVRELQYGDSLRVLVFPATERDQIRLVSMAEFQDMIARDDYAQLLRSKTARYDLTFTAPPSNRTTLVLTPDARSKLTPLVTLLRTRAKLSFAVTAHTDTVGLAGPNKLVTERRAAALRAYFISNGLRINNYVFSGRGETEPLGDQQSLNRRIEFQCMAIQGVSLLFSEPYVPPKRPEPVVQKSTATPATQETYTRTQPVETKPKKAFSIIVFGEGLYTLEALADSWVDPDKGPGILQGFGGGLLVTYFLTPGIGVSVQGGYSQWQVRRRYVTPDGAVQYTNDQSLQRISGLAGFRLYALKAVYIQPMVGGQMLTLSSENSETHPDGTSTAETQKFFPTAGGSIGFELGKSNLLIDVAAQYYFTPNQSFSTVTEPLHFVGLRLGVGFRSQKKN